MKVKIIKDYKIMTHWIRKDEILTVRVLGKYPIDLSPKFQIIEGACSGEFIPRECFVELPAEKTYTENEYKYMKNFYEKQLEDEREKVNKLQGAQNEFLRELESFLKQIVIAGQVSKMLKDWLDTSYDGDEKTDRDNFSLKITKFIQGKLV